MEAVGVRCADLDPRGDPPGQVADQDRGLVGGGDALGERDALTVLEAVREHPRHHERGRLGRMLRHAQGEIVVDPAVDVGQLHREGVHRRPERHKRPA